MLPSGDQNNDYDNEERALLLPIGRAEDLWHVSDLWQAGSHSAFPWCGAVHRILV